VCLKDKAGFSLIPRLNGKPATDIRQESAIGLVNWTQRLNGDWLEYVISSQFLCISSTSKQLHRVTVLQILQIRCRGHLHRICQWVYLHVTPGNILGRRLPCPSSWDQAYDYWQSKNFSSYQQLLTTVLMTVIAETVWCGMLWAAQLQRLSRGT